MKRPSKAGLLVVLAFLVIAIVEFRTVLSMVGIDVSAEVYFPVAGVTVLIAIVAILLLPERTEGNPSKA